MFAAWIQAGRCADVVHCSDRFIEGSRTASFASFPEEREKPDLEGDERGGSASRSFMRISNPEDTVHPSAGNAGTTDRGPMRLPAEADAPDGILWPSSISTHSRPATSQFGGNGTSTATPDSRIVSRMTSARPSTGWTTASRNSMRTAIPTWVPRTYPSLCRCSVPRGTFFV